MKTCLECFNLFDRDSNLIPGSLCPIMLCCGQVIEIDDNILHTITQLNEKGYSTAYCCAGHTWGNQPFIVFEDSVYTDAFPYLPKDFKSQIIHDDTLRIFKTIPPCSAIDIQKHLMDASIDLMVWSESLPLSVLLIADFELVDKTKASSFSYALKQKLNIVTKYFSKENGNSKSVTLTTSLSPDKAKELEKKIECFANEEEISVSVDIFN